MENLKKSRTPLRALFTKAVNKLDEYVKQNNSSKTELNILLANVEKQAEKIFKLDQQINDLMMTDEHIGTDEFEKEYESCLPYEEKMNICRCIVNEILATEEHKYQSENGSIASTTNKKKYKLPKIEITKFSGDIKEWLTWWAQFEKIHLDDELANEDKFHYLRQSTVEKSKARDVVDSFPMTGANYPKVINHLTNRFGNKETLVELYVRELLKLVLANALHPTKKIVVSALYDKVETQLRALESLDVTSDRFSAILYPLVESCLPEDLLRAWERFRIVPIPISAEMEANVQTDRLTNIMKFLRGEVESEERISLARAGFAEQPKKLRQEDKPQDTYTAAGLFVQSQEKQKCIFCETPGHFSSKCYVGKKMTLAERQKTIQMQQACTICLAKGHQPKRCPLKPKLKFECGGTHFKFMCPGKPESTNGTSTNLAAISNEIVAKNLLAKPTYQEEVVLSTMMIHIHNGKEKLVVRAAIDSGSHKSYLLKRLVVKLGLAKIGDEILSHELFGGHVTKEIVHNKYTIIAENLSGTASHKFDVLEQDRICHNVPKLRRGPWIDELKAKGIELTDLGTGSSEIELLIGSNLAGMLLTDIHKFEKDSQGFGLVALNYCIGWVVMGQISESRRINNATLIVQSLFVQELDISNLWRLDTIGIEDSAETRKKEKEIENANRRFKDRVVINDEGRYEVALPFLNGSPPIASNKSLSERRLISMGSGWHYRKSSSERTQQ